MNKNSILILFALAIILFATSCRPTRPACPAYSQATQNSDIEAVAMK